MRGAERRAMGASAGESCGVVEGLEDIGPAVPG